MKLKEHKQFNKWYKDFLENAKGAGLAIKINELCQLAYMAGQANPVVPQHIEEAMQELNEIEEPEVEDNEPETVDEILAQAGTTGYESIEMSMPNGLNKSLIKQIMIREMVQDGLDNLMRKLEEIKAQAEEPVEEEVGTAGECMCPHCVRRREDEDEEEENSEDSEPIQLKILKDLILKGHLPAGNGVVVIRG